ncbi:MAG: HEAT repeat domain-containing protein [Planctomycetota bacterium]|jgi:HEAT repeat protein
MNRALRVVFIASVVAVAVAVLAWLGWGLAVRLPIDRAAARLTGKDSRARRDAVAYLVNSERPYATERLAAFLATQPRPSPERSEVLAAMAEAGPKAITPMLLALHPGPRALSDPAAPPPKTCARQREARDLVQRIGPPATPHLIALMDWPDDAIRDKAIELLGYTGDPSAAAALVNLLDDPACAVQWAALRGLGHLRDPTTVEPIIRVLESPGHPAVRGAAAWVLGDVGDRRAVGPIIRTLGDRDTDVRSYAASAFQRIVGHSTGDPLLRWLGDPECRLRDAAAVVLTDISEERAVEQLMMILLNGDSSARAVPTSGLQDTEPRIKAAAATTLSILGDFRGTQVLIEMLGDPDVAIQADAVQGLSFSRDPRAVPALSKRLSEGRPGRLETVRALARIGTPEALKAVDEHLDVDLGKFAAEYRAYIRRGDPRELAALAAVLECSGTLAMAEDYYLSGNDLLRTLAVRWAERNHLHNRLPAAADTPDRPKWGIAAPEDSPETE